MFSIVAFILFVGGIIGLIVGVSYLARGVKIGLATNAWDRVRKGIWISVPSVLIMFLGKFLFNLNH